MKKVKIYGERNTGTNYLEKLIAINFSVKILSGSVPLFLDRIANNLKCNEILRDGYFKVTQKYNLGWKHREIDNRVLETLDENTSIIALVKNPYSWLLSMHKRPYHFDREPHEEFYDFLRGPRRALGRESNGYEYKNAIDIWNKKNQSYYDLSRSGRCKVLCYEDLLSSPLEELRKIKRELSFPTKHGFPRNYSRAAKAGDAHLDANYYLDYYGNELWKEKLDTKSIEFINQNLNVELMTKIGYRIL